MTERKFGLGVLICIFNRDFSKMLLLKRNEEKRKKNNADWGYIGGRVELGEKLIDACLREAKEEIGVDLNPKKLKLIEVKETPHLTEVFHAIHFVYAAILDENEKIILNFNGIHESDEYKWFDLKELPEKMLDKKQEVIEIADKAKKMFKEGKMKKIWSIKHPEWGDFEMEWSDKTDFEKLDNVIGAQGFVFNDKGKFCIIKLSCKKHWLITGGKPEKFDKSFEDTLIRETEEEADLEIKDIKRVGYIISYKKDNPEKKEYSLRYAARVKKIKPQTIDPAYNEIPKRKFIFPEEFDKYCGWGENGDFQIKKVLRKIKFNKIKRDV